MTACELEALIERHFVEVSRQYYCASLIASTVYNMNINPKKTKALRLDHFVPKRKKKQGAEGQRKVAESIAKLLGGKVDAGRNR